MYIYEQEIMTHAETGVFSPTILVLRFPIYLLRPAELASHILGKAAVEGVNQAELQKPVFSLPSSSFLLGYCSCCAHANVNGDADHNNTLWHEIIPEVRPGDIHQH